MTTFCVLETNGGGNKRFVFVVIVVAYGFITIEPRTLLVVRTYYIGNKSFTDIYSENYYEYIIFLLFVDNVVREANRIDCRIRSNTKSHLISYMRPMARVVIVVVVVVVVVVLLVLMIHTEERY